MIEYKYKLEPYKGMNTRHQCPSCQQKDKTFSLYIDTDTGEHIHPAVGRCNRESNCGHHYTPKQYFQENNVSFDTPQVKANKPRLVAPPPKSLSFIPTEKLKGSLKGYESNHFVIYLIDLFGLEVTNELVGKYFIGTSKHWNGASVFWQIDAQGKVRTGKIMLYNPLTGKRVKEPFNHITWVHTRLNQPDYALQQCFFGEHLLKEKSKPVAIVESEKTALIASAYLPEFIWLAAGNADGLNASKCSILKGRSVTLFPDLNAYEKWKRKAQEFSRIATFQVSDLLEKSASEAERRNGLDIADYFERFSLREYLKGESPSSEYIKHLRIENGILVNQMGYPADWDLSGSYTDLATKHYIKWVCRKLG